MNQKLTNFFKSSRTFLGKHSPEILTGIGICGMISTVVLAVKATPKALELIETEEYERKEKLEPLEVVKVAWKPYIPAVGIGIGSIACIVGASAVNYKRNAALGAAYAISERTLLRYRDKVIDTIGEKKEREIRGKAAQEAVDNNKITNQSIIVTSKGNTLCMDTISGRYFRSDIETIKQTINKINRRLVYDQYISLNEFYWELGLEGIKDGGLLGWNLSQGLLEPSFSTCLTEDDQPCIVMDLYISPKYDFDKLL